MAARKASNIHKGRKCVKEYGRGREEGRNKGQASKQGVFLGHTAQSAAMNACRRVVRGNGQTNEISAKLFGDYSAKCLAITLWVLFSSFNSAKTIYFGQN